jgi:hypothetical protein
LPVEHKLIPVTMRTLGMDGAEILY